MREVPSSEVRILLLGGSGFIGTHLVKEFAGLIDLTVLTRDKLLISKNYPSELNYKIFDFRDLLEENIVEPFDFIINAIRPRKGARNLDKEAPINIEIKKIIQNYANQKTLVINLGTYIQHFSVTPTSYNFEYSMNKIQLNSMLKELEKEINFRYLELSLFTVFGPGDSKTSLASLLVDSIKSGSKLVINSSLQLIAYTHVYDVVAIVRQIVLTMETNLTGHFSFWPVPPVTIEQLIKRLESKFEVNIDFDQTKKEPAGHELFHYEPSMFPHQFEPNYQFIEFESYIEEILPVTSPELQLTLDE